MEFTLDSLLADLEKQAGVVLMDKQASDGGKEDPKDKKEESKEEKKDEEKAESKEKEALNKAEKAVADAKEADKKEEQYKEAQVAGAALAQEVMQKVASAKSTDSIITKDTEMNKQAAVAGKALADALLTKLAGVGDTNTVAGIPQGVAPSKIQVDNATMVQEQDATIKPTPGTDGLKSGGSINQIFDAIVADAMSQGAASHDQVHTTGVASQEGAVEAHAVPNQAGEGEAVEKAAAVSALVNSGFDFETAVNMVKQAEAELNADEETQIKQAAFDNLVANGVDPELAVALVKQAGLPVPFKGGELVAQGGKAGMSLGKKMAIGAGIAAGVAGAGYAAKKMQEKKAAFDALCGAGVDFDTAVALVNAKADEIYGA